MSSQFRIRAFVILGLAGAIALLSLLLRSGGDAGGDGPDATLLDLIRAAETEAAWPGLDVASAASALETPEAAAAFMRSGVVLQDYPGRYADPREVLLTRGANAEDQSVLLAALIEAMGHEARLREAAWPDRVIERLIPVPGPRPARSLLAAHLGLVPLADTDPRAAEARALTRSLLDEVDAAHAVLSQQASLAPPRRHVRPDRRLVVDYLDETGAWRALDPILPGEPVHGGEAVEPGAITPVIMRLDLVTAAGERRRLIRFELDPASEARLSFVPASEPAEFLFGAPDPEEVTLWRPVLQQGARVELGGAFTPGGRTPPTTPEYALSAASPALTAAEITDIDLSAWPEVALTVQTNAAPGAAWRGDHIAVSDGGDPAVARVEALPQPARDIAVITDVSPSMVSGGRIFAAGEVGRALLSRTSRRQNISLATSAQTAAVQHERGLFFSPDQAIDAFEAGLVIRPGDDLTGPIAAVSNPFYGPVDVVILTDGEVADDQLRALAALRRGEERRIIAVTPHHQAPRFEPVTDHVFILPDEEGDAARVGSTIADLAGSRLKISYIAHPAPPGAARTVVLSFPGSDVSAQTQYQTPQAASSGARLELAFERAGAPLGEPRAIADLGEAGGPWALMAEHAILVSGGRFSPDAISRGLYGAERYIHELSNEIAEASPPPGPNGELMAAAQSVSGLTERGSGVALTGDRLQILLLSSAPFLDGEDLVLRRQIDLLSDGGLGDSGGARAGLAVASAEAATLGGGGLNPRLLAAERVTIGPRTPLPENWPGAALRSVQGAPRTLIATPDGQAGWLLEPDGRVSVRSFMPVAKGAAVEAVVERFDRIRNGLGLSGSVASGLLSPYGVPGAKVGVLVAILDLDARLFCASSVMMGFVSEAIERGDDGEEDWQAYAEDKCDIDLEGALGELAKGAFVSAVGGAAADELTRFGLSMRGPEYTYFDEAYINTEAGEFIRAIFEDLSTLAALMDRRPDQPSDFSGLAERRPPSSESTPNAAQTEP